MNNPKCREYYLLEALSNQEKDRLKDVVLHAQDGEAVNEIRKLIDRHGTLQKSMTRAESYIQSAKDEIAQIQKEDVRQSLMQLADYTLKRNR